MGERHFRLPCSEQPRTQLNPPDFRFFAYRMQDGALLTSEAADNKEKPGIKKKIAKDEYAALYKIFRDFFQQSQTKWGSKPDQRW